MSLESLKFVASKQQEREENRKKFEGLRYDDLHKRCYDIAYSNDQEKKWKEKNQIK